MVPLPAAFRRAAVLAIALACPLTAVADDPAASDMPVRDLADCVAIALQESPTLAVAAENTGIAGQGVRQARGQFLPSLSLSRTWQKSERTEYDYENPVTLAISDYKEKSKYKDYGASSDFYLFRGLSDFGSLRAARYDLRAAEANEAYSRQQVIEAVAAAYIGLLRSERLLDVAVQSEDLAVREYEKAETYHRIGSAARSDVLSAKVRQEQTRLEVIRARNAVEQAFANLAHAMNRPLAERFDVDRSLLEHDDQVEDLDALFAEAVANRQDLRSRQYNVEARGGDVMTAAGLYPAAPPVRPLQPHLERVPLHLRRRRGHERQLRLHGQLEPLRPLHDPGRALAGQGPPAHRRVQPRPGPARRPAGGAAALQQPGRGPRAPDAEPRDHRQRRGAAAPGPGALQGGRRHDARPDHRAGEPGHRAERRGPGDQRLPHRLVQARPRRGPSPRGADPMTGAGEVLIRVADLTRVYQVGGEEVRAVDGVDLEIAKGEYVAIMGASGSGKSTLMNLIGCLDTPSSGSYVLNGAAVAEMDDDALAAVRNREIGFVFQTFNLLPRLTAAQNVELPLIYGGVGAAERRERVAKVMAQVGLTDRAAHQPNEMSGGQRQRVAIARALVCRPSLILADEPTGNLDSTTSEEIMSVLDGLHAGGNTILVVTHEEDIAAHARRIIRLRDGRIESDAPNPPRRHAAA
ncbi:MAG: ATP-binding cassette domain-containing protein [bacterium]|nr:ATP-binding cassette domain-containing protein [bacterium]